MSDFWRNRKVLVTGGSGFIGSYVVEALVGRQAEVTATVYEDPAGVANLDGVRDRIHTRVVDLTLLEHCMEVCRGQSVVLNIAHVDGSVAFKKNRPAYILRQNMLITLNMLEAAARQGVERFLLTSSAEVYPLDSPSPTPESEVLRNMTDRPADGYAWSKRMSEVAARIYAREYGMKVAIARPNNAYGPRDYFDDERGRVIPMFIRKALSADQPIVIWGSGETIRTFLYVEDLARGLLSLAENYCECDPVNFGGNEEISIRELAEMVVRLSGSQTPVICDLEKPSGAGRRTTDTRKAEQVLGFLPAVSLETGILRTMDACRRQMTTKRYAGVHGA